MIKPYIGSLIETKFFGLIETLNVCSNKAQLIRKFLSKLEVPMKYLYKLFYLKNKSQYKLSI